VVATDVVGFVVADASVAAFFASSIYFCTGAIADFRSCASFFDTELKYAMIADQSSSLAGKLGMRMPSKIFGRICTTFLKKLNSQLCWILLPSPRREGGARSVSSSVL